MTACSTGVVRAEVQAAVSLPTPCRWRPRRGWPAISSILAEISLRLQVARADRVGACLAGGRMRSRNGDEEP